nr:MAG TPA: tail protein [Caudoviricetes sp.]
MLKKCRRLERLPSKRQVDSVNLERDIDISRYLTPVSRDSLDIQEIMKAENPEFRALWDAMCDILINQYISTATGYGLEQWEAIFDVLPGVNDTVEVRRDRIMTLLGGSRPYTLRKLQELLDVAFGKGNVLPEINGDKYEIWFTLSKNVVNRVQEIYDWAEPIIPKNLIMKSQSEQSSTETIYFGGRVVAESVNEDISINRMNEIRERVYYGGRLALETV